MDPKNINVDNELSNRKIKKVNEECDLGIGFDDIFKTKNHILSIILKVNGMIPGWFEILFQGGWGANVVSKTYQAQIKFHIENCTLGLERRK